MACPPIASKDYNCQTCNKLIENDTYLEEWEAETVSMCGNCFADHRSKQLCAICDKTGCTTQYEDKWYHNDCHMYREDIKYLWELRSLVNLKYKEDWSGYGIPAPNEKALEQAEIFLRYMLYHFQPSKISPSSDEGVALTFKNNHRKIVVVFYNEGDSYALLNDSITKIIETHHIKNDFRSNYKFKDKMYDWLQIERKQ